MALQWASNGVEVGLKLPAQVIFIHDIQRLLDPIVAALDKRVGHLDSVLIITIYGQHS